MLVRSGQSREGTRCVANGQCGGRLYTSAESVQAVPHAKHCWQSNEAGRHPTSGSESLCKTTGEGETRAVHMGVSAGVPSPVTDQRKIRRPKQIRVTRRAWQ